MLPNLEEKLDPRVKRTRKYLEAAFKELLEEKGFQAVTVQDITERAEVNRATFYAHFFFEESKFFIGTCSHLFPSTRSST